MQDQPSFPQRGRNPRERARLAEAWLHGRTDVLIVGENYLADRCPSPSCQAWRSCHIDAKTGNTRCYECGQSPVLDAKILKRLGIVSNASVTKSKSRSVPSSALDRVGIGASKRKRVTSRKLLKAKT